MEREEGLEESESREVVGIGILKYCGYAIRFSYVSFSRCDQDSSGGRKLERGGRVRNVAMVLE